MFHYSMGLDSRNLNANCLETVIIFLIPFGTICRAEATQLTFKLTSGFVM